MAVLSKVKVEGENKAAPRPRNFTDDEDVWLARAYAKTSVDPVLGSGQKKGVFWSKVFSTFVSLRNDDGGVIQVGFERDMDSIRNRWQRRIKPESKEFAAILNGFPKKSGENDERYFDRLVEEYKNKNNVPFRFIKAWEYLKDLPDFGYEVQVAGLPEVHQHDGEKDSAVATARMTTPRPMGAKAAKRAQVQAQNSQKKSKAMAEVVKGMGSKVEEVAKAMREKSMLDHYHRMLEFYSRAGNQEKVEETIAKMDTFMGDKFLVVSGSEKAADSTDDSGDGSINDDSTVSEVE